MFMAAKNKKTKLFEVKLAEYFVTVDMSRSPIDVDDKDEDTTEREVDYTKFVLSVDVKPKLESRRSFREDLEVTKKILNLPTDAAITDDEPETIDVWSQVTDGDVSNALAYWYKKGLKEVKKFNKS